MDWSKYLTELNYVLAGLYPFREDWFRIVSESGIPPSHVAFRDKAINTWYEVLREALIRKKIPNIIRIALKDYPQNPILVQADKGELTDIKGPILGKDIQWKGDPPNTQLEKLMGKQSTLLPISFLEVGVDRARSVARIRLDNGSSGTGFLIKDNLLVTNNHVLKNKDQASVATIQFNYQQTADGLDLEPTEIRLEPSSGFVTSVEDDWTIVRMGDDANADWGAIELQPIDIEKTERVNIIQHPGGGPKNIALYHNFITFADENRVQYLTDTLPGSSGSPVFDDHWRLVALHHSGGWILEPNTKDSVFRNEGININRVVEGLRQSKL
jgi:V8-like Glu-specific endopeptidase